MEAFHPVLQMRLVPCLPRGGTELQCHRHLNLGPPSAVRYYLQASRALDYQPRDDASCRVAAAFQQRTSQVRCCLEGQISSGELDLLSK